MAAFLRACFHQFLSQQYQAENLCPLRDNVARYLSPFGFRIGMYKDRDPDDAGDGQEDGQRVFADRFKNPVWRLAARLLALA